MGTWPHLSLRPTSALRIFANWRTLMLKRLKRLASLPFREFDIFAFIAHVPGPNTTLRG